MVIKMWGLGQSNFKYNSGWILYTKTETFSNDGFVRNKFSVVSSGFKPIYVENDKSFIREGNGNYQGYSANMMIPIKYLTGTTLSTHDHFLYNSDFGMFKIVKINNYKNLNHFRSYYLYLENIDMQSLEGYEFV